MKNLIKWINWCLTYLPEQYYQGYIIIGTSLERRCHAFGCGCCVIFCWHSWQDIIPYQVGLLPEVPCETRMMDIPDSGHVTLHPAAVQMIKIFWTKKTIGWGLQNLLQALHQPAQLNFYTLGNKICHLIKGHRKQKWYMPAILTSKQGTVIGNGNR